MPHLRVSALPFLFLVTVSEDGILGGRYGGMFHTVCGMMNTTYSVSPPQDFVWGDCNQTTCSGMFAPVLQNESEVALGPHCLLETYAQHFEQGNPIAYRQFYIVTGMHTAYAIDSSSVLRILDTGMYICIFLAPWMIASSVVVTAWLEHLTARDPIRKPETLGFGVLVIAGYQTILSQSGQYLNRSASSRLILVAFLSVCLFVSILFSSFVKASMMTKPPTKRISYLSDLIREEGVRAILLDKTYLIDLIKLQGKVSSDYRQLATIFDRNGLLKTPSEMLSLESTTAIFNGTGFTLAGCELFRFFFYRGWQELDETDKGYFYCSKEPVLSVHITWYFSRISVPKEFIREFNRRTRWLIESPQTHVREYRLPQIPMWYKVHDTALNEETADPIAFQDILGSVYIYSGGLLISCALLLLEMLGHAMAPIARVPNPMFSHVS